ncbi:hypothetical protein TevJSym_as00180 [endosymbiont of Tevnia jerichonana (vent Tica)]|uniref:Uncharacterized protein n=1 Tax=endosymbiont of Tevnia jerichonana (vent Tica) TaxID=1049564 RepID=G2FGV6_9GAMM|nr:hypothetical protein TevJSym_as00180 [endosymbiont of Tevnia jerichonana (vent Tica)]
MTCAVADHGGGVLDPQAPAIGADQLIGFALEPGATVCLSCFVLLDELLQVAGGDDAGEGEFSTLELFCGIA